MKNEKSRSHKHLALEQRKMIERYLDEGKTFARIARDMDVSPSTVYREVQRNRRFEGMSHSKGADRNDCEHLKSCRLKGICGHSLLWSECSNKLCRRCVVRKCQDYCDDYERRTCLTVKRAPLVCNACERYSRCTIERYRYFAESAQVSATRRNCDARRGFDLTARIRTPHTPTWFRCCTFWWQCRDTAGHSCSTAHFPLG